MNKLKEKIYSALNYEGFYNKELVRNVYCYRYKKDSDNSLMFSKTKEVNKPDLSTKEEKKILLIDIFKISNSKEFKEKYDMAISGDGNEYRRITTLTSSTLCALLFFYNIKNKNININGITYDDVLFEVKNKVFDSNNPSNMDIVLLSSTSKTILFLESKFSEYLYHSKARNISNKYKAIYNELELEKNGYSYHDNNDGTFNLESINNDLYVSGIKQMISHYISVNNFIKDGISLGRLELKDYNVILGEIMFNAWSSSDESFENYRKAYKNLINLFIKHNKNHKLNFISEPLEYANIFNNYDLDEEVKKIYRINE